MFRMRVQNVNPKQKIPEAGKRDNILAVLFTCFGDKRMLFAPYEDDSSLQFPIIPEPPGSSCIAKE